MKYDKIVKNRFKVSCCQSYLTPKGRCYDCPELGEESSSDKDPDQEQW